MGEFEPGEAELLEPVGLEAVVVSHIYIDSRDYFAGMALQGILANPTNNALATCEITKFARQLADDLVEELRED